MSKEKDIHPSKQQTSKFQPCPDNCVPTQQFSSVLAVKWAYRWEVFRRLKALDIQCQCSTNEPLLVYLNSATTVMQVWSVVKQFNASRQELVEMLDNCWQLEYR